MCFWEMPGSLVLGHSCLRPCTAHLAYLDVWFTPVPMAERCVRTQALAAPQPRPSQPPADTPAGGQDDSIQGARLRRSAALRACSGGAARARTVQLARGRQPGRAAARRGVCAARSVLPVRTQSKRVHSKCGQTRPSAMLCTIAVAGWEEGFRASFAALSQQLSDGCNLDKTPTDRVKHRRSG